MSLMNDMLRDLEKRQAPDRTQQVDAQGYGALTQKASASSNPAVIVLLSVIIVLLLVLAVGWWYLSLGNTKSDNAFKEGSPVSDTQHLVPEKEAESKVKAIEVTAESATKPLNRQIPNTEAPITADVSQKVIPPNVATADIEEAVNTAAPQQVQAKQTLPSKNTVVPKSQTVARKPQPQLPLAVKQVELKTVATPKPAAAPKPVETNSRKTVATELTPAVVSKVLVVSAEQRDENAAEAAEALISSGQMQDAKIQLTTFIEANRVDVKSRALLATLLMNDGNMAGANALLTSDKLALSSHLRRLKAHWLAQNGQPNEAIALLNTNRPSIEADPEYHVLLAALYQQQGFSSEAVASYAELLSYNPKVADWWAGMAIALDSSQQYPSAKRAYQKALRMDGLRFELSAFAKQRLATIGG